MSTKVRIKPFAFDQEKGWTPLLNEECSAKIITAFASYFSPAYFRYFPTSAEYIGLVDRHHITITHPFINDIRRYSRDHDNYLFRIIVEYGSDDVSQIHQESVAAFIASGVSYDIKQPIWEPDFDVPSWRSAAMADELLASATRRAGQSNGSVS